MTATSPEAIAGRLVGGLVVIALTQGPSWTLGVLLAVLEAAWAVREYRAG